MSPRPRVPDLTDSVCFRKTLFIFLAHFSFPQLVLFHVTTCPKSRFSPKKAFLLSCLCLRVTLKYNSVWRGVKANKGMYRNNQYISTKKKNQVKFLKKVFKNQIHTLL